METSEKCPKCGAKRKSLGDVGQAILDRIHTIEFECGSSVGNYPNSPVASSEQCLRVQLAAEKKGREEAEAKYNELASRIDGYPRTCDVERIARLTTVLGMCRNELAWLMEQTGAKEGGSVWRAYEAATALLQPQGGCDE